MDADDSKAVPLWHVGTKRCDLTPASLGPPFAVLLFDGDTLQSRLLFSDHDEATRSAVEALRLATVPPPTAPES